MSSLHYNWTDLVKKKGGAGRNEIGEASYFLCVKSTKLSMRTLKSWLTCYGALCAEEYISVGSLTAQKIFYISATIYSKNGGTTQFMHVYKSWVSDPHPMKFK